MATVHALPQPSDFLCDPEQKIHYLEAQTGKKKPRRLVIPDDLFEFLLPHQREGVQWMWSLHQMKNGGGVLGDDMGLGKIVGCIGD